MPHPTAIIEGQQVRITRSRAACAGPEGVTFYAPTWRPMVFRTIEAAKAKMERHPGFQGWAS